MRYSSGTTASDYRYTGQLEQAQIGLDYYIARWYDLATGHFIQADTVISDPAKAKTWDKYAYVNNNPIKFIDSSGHETELCGEDCEQEKPGILSLDEMAALYGIKFTKETTDGPDWSVGNMAAVLTGVYYVATALARVHKGKSSVSAFRAVYGINGQDSLFEFQWGCSNCVNYGITGGPRHISFRQMYDIENDPLGQLKNRTLTVHELAHAFENAMEITDADGRTHKPARDSLPETLWTTRSDMLNTPLWVWQQSSQLTAGEVFADMFLQWTFNINMSEARENFMARMPGYMYSAIHNQGGQ